MRDKTQGGNEVTSTNPQARGPLSSTPGPFQDPDAAVHDGKRSAGITSSVGQNNAPGRAGSVGEALGALGYGGATVERPKEEQGLGEKIVNFLGA